MKYVSQGEAAAPNAVINDNPQCQTGKPFMLDFFFGFLPLFLFFFFFFLISLEIPQTILFELSSEVWMPPQRPSNYIYILGVR